MRTVDPSRPLYAVRVCGRGLPTTARFVTLTLDLDYTAMMRRQGHRAAVVRPRFKRAGHSFRRRAGEI